MSCTNCFNGCAEILSDQCIKYKIIELPNPASILVTASFTIVVDRIANA